MIPPQQVTPLSKQRRTRGDQKSWKSDIAYMNYFEGAWYFHLWSAVHSCNAHKKNALCLKEFYSHPEACCKIFITIITIPDTQILLLEISVTNDWQLWEIWAMVFRRLIDTGVYVIKTTKNFIFERGGTNDTHIVFLTYVLALKVILGNMQCWVCLDLSPCSIEPHLKWDSMQLVQIKKISNFSLKPNAFHP